MSRKTDHLRAIYMLRCQYEKQCNFCQLLKKYLSSSLYILTAAQTAVVASSSIVYLSVFIHILQLIFPLSILMFNTERSAWIVENSFIFCCNKENQRYTITTTKTAKNLLKIVSKYVLCSLNNGSVLDFYWYYIIFAIAAIFHIFSPSFRHFFRPLNSVWTEHIFLLTA